MGKDEVERIPCPKCDGSGDAEVDHPDCPDCRCFNECPKCDGVGEIPKPGGEDAQDNALRNAELEAVRTYVPPEKR